MKRQRIAQICFPILCFTVVTACASSVAHIHSTKEGKHQEEKNYVSCNYSGVIVNPAPKAGFLRSYVL
jgi:hypothetical protein